MITLLMYERSFKQCIFRCSLKLCPQLICFVFDPRSINAKRESTNIVKDALLERNKSGLFAIFPVNCTCLNLGMYLTPQQ